MRRKFARSIAAVCYLTVLFSQVDAPCSKPQRTLGTATASPPTTGTDSTNWRPAGLPTNDGTADVIFGGTNRLTPNVDTNNPWKINSLTFNSTAGAFAIHENQLTNRRRRHHEQQHHGHVETSTTIFRRADQTWAANTSELAVRRNGYSDSAALTVTGAKNTILRRDKLFGRQWSLNKRGAGNSDVFRLNSRIYRRCHALKEPARSPEAVPASLPGNVNYTINSGTLDLQSQDLTMKRLEAPAARSS